eukprot:30109-Pelagococcus_subviridis.AAC.3
MRRIFKLDTEELSDRSEIRSYGSTDTTSMGNHPLRYIRMIVPWWKMSCPSTGFGTATKKFKTMSQTNRKSTHRLMKNRAFSFVGRNATSTGVTMDVNMSRTIMTTSQCRMYHARGEMMYFPFSRNSGWFFIRSSCLFSFSSAVSESVDALREPPPYLTRRWSSVSSWPNFLERESRSKLDEESRPPPDPDGPGIATWPGRVISPSLTAPPKPSSN